MVYCTVSIVRDWFSKGNLTWINFALRIYASEQPWYRDPFINRDNWTIAVSNKETYLFCSKALRSKKDGPTWTLGESKPFNTVSRGQGVRAVWIMTPDRWTRVKLHQVKISFDKSAVMLFGCLHGTNMCVNRHWDQYTRCKLQGRETCAIECLIYMWWIIFEHTDTYEIYGFLMHEMRCMRVE